MTENPFAPPGRDPERDGQAATRGRLAIGWGLFALVEAVVGLGTLVQVAQRTSEDASSLGAAQFIGIGAQVLIGVAGVVAPAAIPLRRLWPLALLPVALLAGVLSRGVSLFFLT